MLPFVGVPADVGVGAMCDGDGGSVNVLVTSVSGRYKKTSHKYLLSVSSVTFGQKSFDIILHTFIEHPNMTHTSSQIALKELCHYVKSINRTSGMCRQ